jgi:hypothetical protein
MHAQCYTTWEPEDADGNIPAAFDFQITATVHPGHPGSMYGGPDQTGSPPEPPEVEDLQVCLETIHDNDADGKPRTRSALGEPKRTELEQAFRRHIAANRQLRVALELELCESAAEASEPTDDAYDRWRDEQYENSLPLEEHP